MLHQFNSMIPSENLLFVFLFTLQMVMCGGVPAMVRSVSLYSTCSSGNVTVIGRSVKATGHNIINAPYREYLIQTK